MQLRFIKKGGWSYQVQVTVTPVEMQGCNPRHFINLWRCSSHAVHRGQLHISGYQQRCQSWTLGSCPCQCFCSSSADVLLQLLSSLATCRFPKDLWKNMCVWTGNIWEKHVRVVHHPAIWVSSWSSYVTCVTKTVTWLWRWSIYRMWAKIWVVGECLVGCHIACRPSGHTGRDITWLV